MKRRHFPHAIVAAVLLAGTASGAMAQTLDYDAPVDQDAEIDEGPVLESDNGIPADSIRRGRGVGQLNSGRPRVDVNPYVNASQIVVVNLKGDGNGYGDDYTSTRVGAGLTATATTRRAQGVLGLDYGHNFGWGDHADSDTFNAIASGTYTVIPRQLSIDAGGAATHMRANRNAVRPDLSTGGLTNTADVYSAYIGPSYATNIGPVSLGATYRFGYNRVENDNEVIVNNGVRKLGDYGSSTNHSASVSLGMSTRQLPVGWSVSAGWDREDVDRYDQRYDNRYVRGDVTVPVGRTVALLGGIGYEDIEISQRPVVRDANGQPVWNADGGYQIDKSAPRQLAYATDGLIWDVGVSWRPSPRMALIARYGERYGGTFYSGTAAYNLNRNTSAHVVVYNTLSSFGRSMTSTINGLPAQFNTIRNPFDGSFATCGIAAEAASCLDPALAGVAATNFRSRGVLAALGTRAQGWDVGLAFGVDQRKYISPLLDEFGYNGLTDETYYVNLTASRKLDRVSGLMASAYFNYFDPGMPGWEESKNAGAMVTYQRMIWRRLTGQAAVSLNSFSQDGVNSGLVAAGIVGLSYGF